MYPFRPPNEALKCIKTGFVLASKRWYARVAGRRAGLRARPQNKAPPLAGCSHVSERFRPSGNFFGDFPKFRLRRHSNRGGRSATPHTPRLILTCWRAAGRAPVVRRPDRAATPRAPSEGRGRAPELGARPLSGAASRPQPSSRAEIGVRDIILAH